MNRIGAAALAFALLSGAIGCRGCMGSPSFERRSAEARDPAPRVALEPPVLRVLHFADFGDANLQQAAVAAGIANARRRKPLDLALHAGDNLYDCGADRVSPEAAGCAFSSDGATVAPGYTPPPDPTFAEKFEKALAPLASAGVPVYLALGNHDVATWGSCSTAGDPVPFSRAKACLQVAHRTAAWRMPARHYVIDAPPARFIVLDTNVVEREYGGFTFADELAFLERHLDGCDALACFVVAHHPAATAGDHVSDFTNPAHAARMAQLVAAGGGKLRGWVAGHDHDLQHLRTAGGLDVFVSGNGSRARTRERFERAAPAGATLLYGTIRWGYAILEVSATGFTWRVEDARGTPAYCCAATKGPAWTPCRPVRCD